MDEWRENIADARVLAAMSGGVDSSVMALLLHEQGFDVRGVTMQLRAGEAFGKAAGADSPGPAGPGAEAPGAAACGSSREVGDARTVCERLGIAHDVIDFGDRFDAAVVRPFCDAYRAGLTPNPCVDCNRHLKFAALQQYRREGGFTHVATGHYARRVRDDAAGRWRLLRARDAAKDQSYFLYHLDQDTLAHMLFPLGGLAKEEVRALARSRGLATADKPESQDICFVPDGDYAGFVRRYVSEGRGAGVPGGEGAGAEWGAALGAFAPGEIVNRAGEVLGCHRGLIHYTVGQRKGIGVAARAPLYVLGKDPVCNRLVVGFADEATCSGVVARDVSLVAGAPLEGPRLVQAKTHYRQRPVAAVAEQTGEDELTVTFDEPQRAAAPGQAVVIYDGEEVLGGGTIARTIP